MSKGNDFENDLLLLLFNNTAIANIGDAAGLQPSAGAGSLFVSLHTADPGEAGDQTTSEANYTGYARIGVTRAGAGWTVAANEASNAALITFGACTAGNNTITYIGIGTLTAGAGMLMYSGAVTDPVAGLAVTVGITPKIQIGDLDTTED